MLQRHSSRRTRLDNAVLNQRLVGAASYDRIAGYLRSSLFEVAGESLMRVAGKVRIICNSDLDPQDLETPAAAQASLRRSWCAGKPEDPVLNKTSVKELMYSGWKALQIASSLEFRLSFSNGF